MKKKITPLLVTGIIIFVVFTLADWLIKPLSNWISMPAQVLAIALIVIDGINAKKRKDKEEAQNQRR